MALSLAQRLIAAKKPHARLADNEKLLTDLQTERDRLNAARDQSAGESIDFALSEQDRDDAAAKASRYERTAKGIEAEIAGLEVIIAERRDHDAEQEAESRRAAIRATRDALAEEFAATVPAVIDTLTDLFGRVNDNAAALTAIGDHNGCAEAKARGVLGFVDPNGLRQFTKMQIPGYATTECAWPPVERPIFYDPMPTINAQREALKREEERKRVAAEEFARDHARYEVSTASTTYEPSYIPHTVRKDAPELPAAVSVGWPWVGVLSHTIAQALGKERNLKVTRVGGVTGK